MVAVLPVFVWAGVNLTGEYGDDDMPTVLDIREFRKLELGTEARMVLLYDTVMFVGDNDIYLRGEACAAICLRNTQLDVKKGMVLTGTLVGIRGDDNGMPLLLPSERTSDEDVTCSSFSEVGDHVYTFDELDYKEYVADTETLEDIAGVSGDDGIPMVQDVRRFRELELGTEARMVLLYDTVMFVGGNDIYLRGEACAAICLRNTQLDVKKGMVLKGSLVGIRGDDNGMPLLLPSEHTSDEYLTCNSYSEMEDRVYTFDELDYRDYVADVVTVEDVTLDSLASEDGSHLLYASRNGQRMPVVDCYGVSSQPLSVPAKCRSMRSILAVDGTSLFLIPVEDLSSIVVPSGIRDLIDPRSSAVGMSYYDLQGRRLKGKPAAGIYVDENGKKRIASEE